MQIAYIISAYKYPDQLARLIRRLSSDGTSFLVHIDKKADESVYEAAVHGTRGVCNVQFLHRHRCEWGGFGHVEATLEAVRLISRQDVACDYAVLLTGQDYPLRSNKAIRLFFEANRGKSFMNFFPLPSDEWEHGGLDRIERRHFRIRGRHVFFPRVRKRLPDGLRPYGGSSYWCLDRECVSLIDGYVRHHPEYVRFFRHVDVPDEIFFQTLLLNSPLKERIVNDDLRYIDWKDVRSGSPALLGKGDFEKLVASPKLFARKFDAGVDREVLELLDQVIDSADRAGHAQPPSGIRTRSEQEAESRERPGPQGPGTRMGAVTAPEERAPRTPRVSVIMIFFNEERFIDEAIHSVFAQTHQDWELLLVDDGSSDGSSAIARSYADLYPGRVRYLEHPNHRNLGMSASRNRGIASANGEYLAFLDADDIWLPAKLERQVALLDACPEAAMVYGSTQWWYSWTGRPEDRWRDYVHHLGVPVNSLVEPPVLLTRYLRQEGISPCTCAAILRREAVARVGGFEEEFRGLYEDQAFFAKICLAAPVYVSSECLARYRQDENPDCSKNGQTADQLRARGVFLDWLAGYLAGQQFATTAAAAGRDRTAAVRKALRLELFPYRHPRLASLGRRLQDGLPARFYRGLPALRSRFLRLPLIRNAALFRLRRLEPLGHGRQRGTPIVRYYWDAFLRACAADIRGSALEIGGCETLRRYGRDTVTCADAIDLVAHSPEVTLVADVSRADDLPSERYDCFINPFTMHVIYDAQAALYHAVRMLKPGGTLLVNFPCVDCYFPRGLDMGTGDSLFMYWWFTPIQVENLLRGAGLRESDYTLASYGNLLARVAYQMNMPAEELTPTELDYQDLAHPLLLCARVVKPAGWRAVKPSYRDPWRPQVEPARWNETTGHYAK